MPPPPSARDAQLANLRTRCECALETLTRIDGPDPDGQAGEDWDATRALVAEAVVARQTAPLRLLARELEALVAGLSSGGDPSGIRANVR